MAGIKRVHWPSWKKRVAAKRRKAGVTKAATAIVKRALRKKRSQTNARLVRVRVPRRRLTSRTMVAFPMKQTSWPYFIPRAMTIGATPGVMPNMRTYAKAVFKYTDENWFSLNAPGAGTPSTNIFSLNLSSLYDPYVPTGGHQPRGFDQWCGTSLYYHYRVDKAVVDFTFYPQHQDGVNVAGVGFYNATTPGQIRFCSEVFDPDETVVNHANLPTLSSSGPYYDYYEEYDFKNCAFKMSRIDVPSNGGNKAFKKRVVYNYRKEVKDKIELQDDTANSPPHFTEDGFCNYASSPQFKHRLFVNAINTGSQTTLSSTMFQGTLKYTITFYCTLKTWTGTQTITPPSA